MEPWLDSLSEDWNSEPHSPTPSEPQSRIPHLSSSLRKSSYLKPRSTRGKAVLGERSASSLNLPSPRDRKSSIPRRTSSNFSESQSSVQHHSVNKNETEWKIPSDVDLFSPSKLEGMFTQAEEPLASAKPWGSLKFTTVGQYQSLRAPRRLPTMEVLEEENEPSADSGSVRNTRRQVSDRDPRWRTVSGQQEIKNEVISPITASAANTIRETAVKSEELRRQLDDVLKRPSSSSELEGKDAPEMTTYSLPDDLSMGTELMKRTQESDFLSAILRSSPPVSDASVVRQSPLKLFGNRDTYTSNKLMRVLSQFGQDASTRENSSIEGIRMSQFGEGELDSFTFEKEVARPASKGLPPVKIENRIFHEEETSDEKKRLPSSPAKDRTPKRRRTLLKDEIFVEGVGVEIKVDQVPDKNAAVAGKKRKDARPGENGEQADADVLAARTILRPKAGSRKSSQAKLTEVLAAELETFAKEAQDSRKASLATKDYMEEANKVMEFIRARGKPLAKLSDVHEPIELDSDDILDLEIEDDSTKESFSRPPSRERPSKPREDRRIAKHDARTASQLKKYQETDDLELLASTSAIGTMVIDNREAAEAARVPIPEEERYPPNIRLSGPIIVAEDEFKGLSTSERQDSSASNHTGATGSSGSSGRRGIISHGTVSIPDKVGTMTFDRERQIWIKNKLSTQLNAAEHTPRSTKDATIDEDPFENIPDLSIDEQHELAMKEKLQSHQNEIIPLPMIVESQSQEDGYHSERESIFSASSRDSTSGEDDAREDELSVFPSPSKSTSHSTNFEAGQAEPQTRNPKQVPKHVNSNLHLPMTETSTTKPVPIQATTTNFVVTAGPRLSNHEERLHSGLSSIEPPELQNPRKQARAVTIAFSSPMVSHIVYDRPPSETESDDDASFLPPEDSDYEDYVPTPKIQTPIAKLGTYPRSRSTLTRKMPVINEDDPDDHGMSLIHVENSLTPRTNNELVQQTPAYRGSSILCLTPLSEFTMHQADGANGDTSFVAARPHPKALLPAHGALALSKDELVKAITDVSSEPFWEKMKDLDLTDKKLTSFNALMEYCPSLETLNATKNTIVQLSGLPRTIRRLNISLNCLNDFTSWSHLYNLQRIDVSGNKLASLEGFSSLYHLRDLKASNNRIREIDGIFDLEGLTTLDVSGNEIVDVDFSTAGLSGLEILDMSNNTITTIRNIHTLARLRSLMLDGNSLRDFAGAAPELKHLSLAHNELESIDITDFASIQSLDIDDNAVRSIVLSSTLRRLSARDQRHSFDFVNTILGTPNECSELYLSSNVLTDGQIMLPVLPHYNLQCLELAGCGLRTLPEGFGDFFPNCRTLNVNFNAVSGLSPLLGCVKLRELMLAGNRIHRMRRSCMVLSRLPALGRLDIRDNPLTVGFYAPGTGEAAPFMVSNRNFSSDEKWLHVLDETTALRRRVFELMLADGCKSLKILDGLVFDGSKVLEMEVLWTTLSSKGVLMKPAEADATAAGPDSGHQGSGSQLVNGTEDDERGFVLE